MSVRTPTREQAYRVDAIRTEWQANVEGTVDYKVMEPDDGAPFGSIGVEYRYDNSRKVLDFVNIGPNGEEWFGDDSI